MVSTRSSTVSHRNLRPAFFCSAPGQQAGLGEHLEAVADADDRAAARRELGDRVHHRREPGDRAGAQVVAVREATGHDDRVDAVDRVVAVPAAARRAPPSCSTAHMHVELAVGAGEQDDTDRATLTPSSVTDLVRLDHRVGEQPFAHLVDLRARARRHRVASTTSRIVLPMCTCATFV